MKTGMAIGRFAVGLGAWAFIGMAFLLGGARRKSAPLIRSLAGPRV